MAKKKNGKKKQVRAMQVSRRPRGIATGVQLDAAALCWARLLDDPCNAPLCHPVMSGGNGGLLVRASSYATLSTGAAQTALFIAWTPGVAATIYAAVANDTTAFTLGSQVTNYVPGATYLAGTAGSFRVSAACMKVKWAGTELNRQGYLRFGNVNNSDIGIPGVTSITIAGLSTLLESSCRVPDDTVEIKWRPTDFDQTTSTPNNSDSSTDTGRRGTLLLCASSMAASSSLIIETTAVYEYQPTYNVGITAAVTSTTKSRNTMDQVIEALDNSGSWMYKVGHVVGSVARLGMMAYGAYRDPVGAVTSMARRLTYQPRAQLMG